MTSIVWDEVGSHLYEVGLDRGVLYLPEGPGIPWNGLISVNEKMPSNDGSPIYFDGIKYADVLTFGDFSASLKAYTYPDEFLEFEGVLEVGNGLFLANQQQKRFSLSYRTKIGNDVDGSDLGYKIHVVYNLIATPVQTNYQTISNQANAIEFEWNISAVPDEIQGFRPTAHLIIDTRHMSPALLEDIEETLYGDGVNSAILPPISTLTSFIGDWVIIRITDNGDGTWTATGPDYLITMLDSTMFQINSASAEYLDAETYMISTLTY